MPSAFDPDYYCQCAKRRRHEETSQRMAADLLASLQYEPPPTENDTQPSALDVAHDIAPSVRVRLMRWLNRAR